MDAQERPFCIFSLVCTKKRHTPLKGGIKTVIKAKSYGEESPPFRRGKVNWILAQGQYDEDCAGKTIVA